MSVQDIGQAIWKRRVLVELAVVAAAVFSLAFVLVTGVEYRSTSRMLLTQPAIYVPGIDGLNTQQKLNLQAVTYAALVESPEFVADAARAAGVETADTAVSAETLPNAAVIQLTVSADSRAKANALAEALMEEMTAFFDEVQPEGLGENRVTAVVIQQPAAVLASANPVFTVLSAVIAAAAVAVTAALLLENR